jgi:4-hydroxybenzoate decarboxylase
MRAYQDLREFLAVLEGEKQLLRITEQVSFEPDLAAAACALAQIAEGVPAIGSTISPVAMMPRWS